MVNGDVIILVEKKKERERESQKLSRNVCRNVFKPNVISGMCLDSLFALMRLKQC